MGIAGTAETSGLAHYATVFTNKDRRLKVTMFPVRYFEK